MVLMRVIFLFYLTSHLSYSLCVPTFFISTIPFLYSTLTHKRYLFPQILKITFWLPRILAFGYFLLRSCGVSHCSSSTSASHDSICDRASSSLFLRSCNMCLASNLIIERGYVTLIHVPDNGILHLLTFTVKTLSSYNITV